MQRRASNSGIITIVGQKLALGRTLAHTALTVHVAEHTITIDLDDGGQRTFRRPPGPQPQSPNPPNTSVS